MTPLSLESRELPSGSLVTVAGEIDATNADRFESMVEHTRRPGMGVLLDLHGLTFMDSCGLKALLRLNAAGGLHLVAVQDVPARLLEITGAWQAVTVHTDLQQAIAAVQAIDAAPSAEPA